MSMSGVCKRSVMIFLIWRINYRCSDTGILPVPQQESNQHKIGGVSKTQGRGRGRGNFFLFFFLTSQVICGSNKD